MTRRPLATPDAPQAIGPYSQGIVAGSWVFTAGQIGLDPVTGTLARGIEAQARRALANVEAILAAGGCGWVDVVKTTIFLVDMADFAAVNAIYAEVVGGPAPARSTVAVAALPKDARVEIDAVACKE